MNIGIFTGKLIDNAEILTFDQEGNEPRLAVFFIMKVKNRNNRREPYIVECISFLRDHRIDVVMEKLVKEQMVTVTGDVSIRQFEEEDGFVYSRFALELSNMDIHYVPKEKTYDLLRNYSSVLSRLQSDVDDEGEPITTENVKPNTVGNHSRSAEEDLIEISDAQRMAELFQDDDGVDDYNGSSF